MRRGGGKGASIISVVCCKSGIRSSLSGMFTAGAECYNTLNPKSHSEAAYSYALHFLITLFPENTERPTIFDMPFGFRVRSSGMAMVVIQCGREGNTLL